MGWGEPDVYYQPEKFGLTIVAEVDPSEEYEFDITAVWKHEDGRVFWGQDSGCSCPSPFEGYNNIDDLTELRNYEDYRKLVDHILRYTTLPMGKASTFLTKVRQAMA